MERIDQYIQDNFNRVGNLPDIRVYNLKTKELNYFSWDIAENGYPVPEEFAVGSICMFTTEIFDNKNTLIFPGDIVKLGLVTDMGRIIKYGVVKRADSNFVIDIIRNGKITDFGCFLDDITIDSVEVVGNIFENKSMITSL